MMSDEVQESLGEGVEAGGGDDAWGELVYAVRLEREDIHACGDACFKARVAVFDDGALGGMDVEGFCCGEEESWVWFPFLDVIGTEDVIFEVREEAGDLKGEFNFFTGAGGGDADGNAAVQGVDDVICAVNGLKVFLKNDCHSAAVIGNEALGERTFIFMFDFGETEGEIAASEAFDVMGDGHTGVAQACDEDICPEGFTVDEGAIAVENHGLDLEFVAVCHVAFEVKPCWYSLGLTPTCFLNCLEK